MAVEFINAVNGAGGTGSTVSTSITPGAGSNKLLIVAAGAGQWGGGPRTITGVTAGGTSMLKAIDLVFVDGNWTLFESFWYLTNPGDSSLSCVATASSAADELMISAMAFSGVDQTTPIGNTASISGASGTSATQSVTGVTDGGVIAVCHAYNGTYSVGSGNTERFNINLGNNADEQVGSTKDSVISGSNSVTWNHPSGAKILLLAGLNPAAGAASVSDCPPFWRHPMRFLGVR